jgi:hypothetical protein
MAGDPLVWVVGLSKIPTMIATSTTIDVRLVNKMQTLTYRAEGVHQVQAIHHLPYKPIGHKKSSNVQGCDQQHRMVEGDSFVIAPNPKLQSDPKAGLAAMGTVDHTLRPTPTGAFPFNLHLLGDVHLDLLRSVLLAL